MKFIVITFASFMIFGGANDTYISYNNPEPIKMTVAEYKNSDPTKAAYVTITDAKINLLNAEVLSSKLGGSVSRVYVPIESEEFEQKDSIRLILNTVDSEILDTANELFSLSVVEQIKYIADNPEKLKINGLVTGRLMHSDLMENNRKEEVLKMMKNLESEFYTLNHNSQPSMVRGPVIFVIGLMLLMLAMRASRPSVKDSKLKEALA